MRRDRLYLNDIIEAADAITGFLTDVPEEDFLDSDLLQSAVLQKPFTPTSASNGRLFGLRRQKKRLR